MLEKKHKYIEDLLAQIELLKNRLTDIQKSNSLPFSSLNDAFAKTQKIVQLLHDLEMSQIEEMKGEMSKLVNYLSDVELASKNEGPVITQLDETDNKEIITELDNNIIEREEIIINLEENAVESEPIVEKPSFIRSEKLPIDLPVYTNFFVKEKHEDVKYPKEKAHTVIKTTSSSFNDMIEVPTSNIDLKKRMSINDLFSFQRELFNNDRVEMNNQMTRLSSFNSYEECEKYIKSNFNWDFDNPIVQNFVEVVFDGFND